MSDASSPAAHSRLTSSLPGRRWGLLAVGLACLVSAVSLPWLRLRIPTDTVAVLLGQPTPVTVQTFGFTSLPGIAPAIVADWVILFGLAVLSWRVPRWRRPLTVIGTVVLGILLLLILGLGRMAAESLDVVSNNPTSDHLAGAWLGLAGAVLFGGAIGVSDAASDTRSQTDH